MTENQTRLFTLNETGSAEDYPVSISGGYLYKDDTSNSIKACLQISNKSGKELKSLRFRLHPIDKDGKLLAFDEELDRNGPFKADEPIELEDIMLPFITASFKAELVKAETADGSKLDLQGMPAVREQSEQKSEDNTESSSGEKTPEKSVQEQNSDDARVASFSVNASGNSSDALSMIYGESADYTLNIKNDSEVAVRYQVIISFADDVSDKLAVALGTATPQNGVYNSSENKTVFTFTDSGFCLNVGEEVSKNLVITAKASFLPDENTKVESLSENYGFDTQVLFEQID